MQTDDQLPDEVRVMPQGPEGTGSEIKEVREGGAVA